MSDRILLSESKLDLVWVYYLLPIYTQLAFTCSKKIMETLEKGVKYVPSVNFEQVNLVGKTVSHNPFKNSANIWLQAEDGIIRALKFQLYLKNWLEQLRENHMQREELHRTVNWTENFRTFTGEVFHNSNSFIFLRAALCGWLWYYHEKLNLALCFAML